MSNRVRIADANQFPLQVSELCRWEIEGSQIDKGAIVPDVASLCQVDASQIIRIEAAEADEPNTLIEVFPAPEDLLQAVQEHDNSGLDNEAVALGHLAIIGEKYGAKYILNRPSPANRLVTTTWPGTDRSPGIHVDNRDALPLASRLQSQRRLGLNVGPGARWLLACLPDLISMAQELGRQENSVPNNDVLHEYIDTRPGELKCIWIPLPAGWAYKMPSDAVGHDGSTYGNDSSRMYYFLGHWMRGSLTAA